MQQDISLDSYLFAHSRLVELSGGQEQMSLTKTYVRGRNRQIVSSITSGFSDETEIVRDAENHIRGEVDHHFSNTRDNHGNPVSVDTADPGLLIKRK